MNAEGDKVAVYPCGAFGPCCVGRMSLGDGLRWFYVSSVAVSNAVEVSVSADAEVEVCVALLNAAADPVRWTILQRLTVGQACVCDLQGIVAVAPNLLSYHLKVLRRARLVTCSRRGRWMDYQLAEDAAERLSAALPLHREVGS